MYKVENHEYTGIGQKSYGFSVCRTDGRSLPKSFISSYCATHHTPSAKFQSTTHIEFGIQSPTGDSSDHHNYTFPCVDFQQAKKLVDIKREEILREIKLLNREELYV